MFGFGSWTTDKIFFVHCFWARWTIFVAIIRYRLSVGILMKHSCCLLGHLIGKEKWNYFFIFATSVCHLTFFSIFVCRTAQVADCRSPEVVVIAILIRFNAYIRSGVASVDNGGGIYIYMLRSVENNWFQRNLIRTKICPPPLNCQVCHATNIMWPWTTIWATDF